MPAIGILSAACLAAAAVRLNADQPIRPVIELQSGPLTPGLALDESPRPIHQVRFVVDADLARGTLILDGNRPEFDEFGELVGGLQTPHVRGNGDPKLISEFRCNIEVTKRGPEKWRLHRINGSKLRTPLRIATHGSLSDGGPARLVVLGPENEVQAVVECTRYGLVIP